MFCFCDIGLSLPIKSNCDIFSKQDTLFSAGVDSLKPDVRPSLRLSGSVFVKLASGLSLGGRH